MDHNFEHLPLPLVLSGKPKLRGGVHPSNRTNHGQVDNFSNKNGTLQKDWTIIKSNELSDAFCIAVRGHKGWGSLFKAKYSLVVSFEAIEQNVPIYEPIRTAMEVEIENSEIELELSSNEE